MARVADVLRAKGSEVFRVPVSAPVQDAVAELHARGVGALVVVTDATPADPSTPFPVEELVGVFSERDLVAVGVGARDGSSVGAASTSPVLVTAPCDLLEVLATRMVAERIRHLPVVADGMVVGVVSIGDVVARRVAELAAAADALTDYVRTGRG